MNMASTPTRDSQAVFRHGMRGLVIGAVTGALLAFIVTALPIVPNHDGGSSAIGWFAAAAFGGGIGWFAGILRGRGRGERADRV
jgi:hypothetical protein